MTKPEPSFSTLEVAVCLPCAQLCYITKLSNLELKTRSRQLLSGPTHLQNKSFDKIRKEANRNLFKEGKENSSVFVKDLNLELKNLKLDDNEL